MLPDDVAVSVQDLDDAGAEITLTLGPDGRDLLRDVAAGRGVPLAGAASFVLRRGLVVLRHRVRRHRAMQNRSGMGTFSTPENASPSSNGAANGAGGS